MIDISRRRKLRRTIYTLLWFVHCALKHTQKLILVIADAMLNSKTKFPLRGAAIGNGWMDARRQYPAYLEYAVKHGIFEESSEVNSI